MLSKNARTHQFIFNFIVFMIIISFTFSFSSYNTCESRQDYTNEETLLLSSQNQNNTDNRFFISDFPAKLTQEKQGLGDMYAYGVSFSSFGIISRPEVYPNLIYDITSDYLNLTYSGTDFISTIKSANLDDQEGVLESDVLTIELRDRIYVEYSEASNRLQGYLIYLPKLASSTLTAAIVQNGSENLSLNSNDYTIDDANFFVFDYENFFKNDTFSFTLYLYYKYDVSITEWKLSQLREEEISLIQKEQNITVNFNYQFNVTGIKYLSSSLSDIGQADDLGLFLKVNLVDKDLLYNHEGTVNNNELSNVVDSNNEFDILISADNSQFKCNFTCNYTVEFFDAVDKSWAIDRLVSRRNTRERIYFPTITSGPEKILVKYLTIIENTITSDQVLEVKSLFNRDIEYYEVNISIITEEIQNSLVFTENVIRLIGLKIILPYLIKGEISPFSVKYSANYKLTVELKDDINMPLENVEIKIYYFGVEYGTYVSNNFTQPLSTVITTTNGRIELEDIPNGNYSVRIYDGTVLLSEQFVSPESEINYVNTDVPHNPLVLLVFLLVSCTIIVFGIFLHLKQKRSIKK